MPKQKRSLAEHCRRKVTRYTGYQPERPAWLVIESTNYCNQRCPVCPASQRPSLRPQGFMGWKLFRSLVEDAARLRPERVALHAHGEPLMHPRIVDMVCALADRGLSTEIVTNGELLTPDLSRALLEAGLESLVVSHPAVSPKLYQTYRGQPLPPGKEERLIESFRVWAGAKGRASIRSMVPVEHEDEDAPGGTPAIETTSIEQQEEAKPAGVMPEAPAMRTPSPRFIMKWLATPGVHSVGFHVYMPWPGYCREELLHELMARPRRCEIGMRSLVVLWDGAVTPCSYDYAGWLTVGRFPEQSLGQLYNGPALRRLRRDWFRKPACWPAVCRSCLIPRCSVPMIINTAEDLAKILSRGPAKFVRSPRLPPGEAQT
jgi:hypothetical protein